VSLLITATLTSALATLAGAILLVRQSDRRNEGPPTEPRESAGDTSDSPLGRLKRVIRAGEWRAAAPSLLTMGGILGLMLFGALALIFTFDQSRSGWPMLILALLTIAWAVREYVRA